MRRESESGGDFDRCGGPPLVGKLRGLVSPSAGGPVKTCSLIVVTALALSIAWVNVGTHGGAVAHADVVDIADADCIADSPFGHTLRLADNNPISADYIYQNPPAVQHLGTERHTASRTGVNQTSSAAGAEHGPHTLAPLAAS